jgi:hypothetical protein
MGEERETKRRKGEFNRRTEKDYNSGRIHQTVGVTPAMEAGVTEHVWSVEEIVALMEGR